MRSETNWFLWHPMFEILQVSSLPMGEVHVMNTDSMATPSGSSMGGPSVVNAMVGKICSDTPWVSLSHMKLGVQLNQFPAFHWLNMEKDNQLTICLRKFIHNGTHLFFFVCLWAEV